MENKILQAIIKTAKTKIPHPWDKIFRMIAIIILLVIPALFALLCLSLFSFFFFLEHLSYGYSIDLIGFSILSAITLVVLLIHHTFSKTKSISRLFRWVVALIFIEVIACIWFNAWNWQYYITDLSLDDSVMGYALPIEDRLEIILTYTKALFQTVALGLMLIVGRMYIKK